MQNSVGLGSLPPLDRPQHVRLQGRPPPPPRTAHNGHWPDPTNAALAARIADIGYVLKIRSCAN
jgi:hypothetical protein